MFTGRFKCMVATLAGKPDVLDGVINLVLMGSSEAQTLDISGGLITVYDENMNRVVLATLGGELNCGTQRFTATIDPTPSDPMPLERQISWVNLGAQPITTGTLRGSLDPDLQELAGDLVINFDPTAFCAGDFSVKGAVE
jgi:hypothetical protein